MAYITQDGSKALLVDAWRGISDPDSPPRLMVFNAANGDVLDAWEFDTNTQTLGTFSYFFPISFFFSHFLSFSLFLRCAQGD
jgi:hypothetical protein